MKALITLATLLTIATPSMAYEWTEKDNRSWFGTECKKTYDWSQFRLLKDNNLRFAVNADNHVAVTGRADDGTMTCTGVGVIGQFTTLTGEPSMFKFAEHEGQTVLLEVRKENGENVTYLVGMLDQ